MGQGFRIKACSNIPNPRRATTTSQTSHARLVDLVMLYGCAKFSTRSLPPLRLDKHAATASPDLLNDKVNNDKDLRASNEGQHWLDLYGHGTRAFHSMGLKLGSTLSRTWQSSTLPDGIQVAYVQKLVTEQAGALLQHFDEHMDYHWNDFIGALEPPALYYGQHDKQAWLDNGRPVVELIISRIGALRTPAWN